jgi:hypothetical protein
MTPKTYRPVVFLNAGLIAALGLTALIAGTAPANALKDGVQLLTGGGTMSESGDSRYTAPGYTNQLTKNFPGPGLGEEATQLRLRAGVLSKLLVKLTTATAPSSGSFTVRVRINGSNTALKCTLNGTGQCGSGSKTVSVTNKSKLSIRVANDFVGSGNMSYTYVLQYD